MYYVYATGTPRRAITDLRRQNTVDVASRAAAANSVDNQRYKQSQPLTCGSCGYAAGETNLINKPQCVLRSYSAAGPTQGRLAQFRLSYTCITNRI